MSAHFDINTLSREEMDQIAVLVQKKTAMLEKNYVANSEHTLKFIQGVALKSESRDIFWQKLHRKLDSIQTPQTMPSQPSSSGNSNAEILGWFQSNLPKLQGLLSKMSSRGSQNMLVGRLTDALNIAAHTPSAANLTSSQLSLLRELHFSFSHGRSGGSSNNAGNTSVNSSGNSNVNSSSNGSAAFSGPPAGPPTARNNSPPTSYSNPNAPGLPVRRTSPPAPTGPYSGPPSQPVSLPPTNTPQEDSEDAERRRVESKWIADVYVKIHELLRLITELKSREEDSKGKASSAMDGLVDIMISKIQTAEGMKGDPSGLIGDSSITGNALNGLLVILKRYNFASGDITEFESTNEREQSSRLFSSLSLLQMALTSVCYDKYAVPNEDRMIQQALTGGKKRKAFVISTLSHMDTLQPSLGVNPYKRKHHVGAFKMRE